jgi:hypothetical protein
MVKPLLEVSFSAEDLQQRVLTVPSSETADLLRELIDGYTGSDMLRTSQEEAALCALALRNNTRAA